MYQNDKYPFGEYSQVVYVTLRMMLEAEREISEYSFHADLQHYYRTVILRDRKISTNTFSEIVVDAIRDSGLKIRL